MKIIVKLLTGKSFEVALSSKPNIRELHNKIASELKQPWHYFEIRNIYDQAGNRLCSIFADDSSEEDLIDFIRKETSQPTLVLDELHVFVTMALGAGFYRPSKHNPDGYAGWAGKKTYPANTFFKDASEQKETFSNRLKNIGISSEELPDEFLDPITAEVMDDPVISSSQITYDSSTLRRLNYVDPSSRQEITIIGPNLQLRSKLETFIAQQEKFNLLLTNNDKNLENSLFGEFKKSM